VTAVAGVPDNPNVYYFGTPGGGIWKTTDAGQVWAPIFDKERIPSIGALAVAPSDSKTIYAGTGEQTPGNGIYKSADEGNTWTHAGLENTRFIQSVIVNPQNPDVVIVGANSTGVNAFSRPAPTKTFSTARGVFQSADGGKTWKQTLSNDETAGVFDLAVDPDNWRTFYASLYVPASGPIPSADEKGGRKANSLIYKSVDGGSTWNPLVSKGLPEKDRGRLGISVAPGTHGRRLYAIMEQGFYRSDDAGATWTESTKDPRIVGDEYFSRIFVDTRNPDILYVAQTSLYRSIDGGNTFAAYVGAPSGDDFHVLWIDPKDPNRLLLGVDQGAILSVDAGKTWAPGITSQRASFTMSLPTTPSLTVPTLPSKTAARNPCQVAVIMARLPRRMSPQWAASSSASLRPTLSTPTGSIPAAGTSRSSVTTACPARPPLFLRKETSTEPPRCRRYFSPHTIRTLSFLAHSMC